MCSVTELDDTENERAKERRKRMNNWSNNKNSGKFVWLFALTLFVTMGLAFGGVAISKDISAGAKSLAPATKASEELKQMLNDAIAREIQVSVQYIWQHVQAEGFKGIALQDVFKKTAIAEMKHAEAIAERLWYLTGTPTTKPTPIRVGDNLREFLELDIKAETEAIHFYKKIIKSAQEEGDLTTEFLFRKILQDEEGHHDLFTTILQEL